MEPLKLIRSHILVSILIVIPIIIKPSFSHHLNATNPHSLDALIHDYVNSKVASERIIPRTGVIYNFTLNSSAIQVSVVRVRSGSLWARGQNISSFHIPPMIIPTPYVKRLVLVTWNLHNLSSHYFDPPKGYVLAGPIVGLAVYNASTTNSLSNTSIDINLTGGAIKVTFENVKNAMCVDFGTDGVASDQVPMNMTGPDECSVFRQGYVGIVAPETSKHANMSFWKRWLAVALAGIIMAGMVMSFVGVLVWRIVRKRRVKVMEMNGEKDVAVGAIWVGQSRLPAGNMSRTQPQLESEMFP